MAREINDKLVRLLFFWVVFDPRPQPWATPFHTRLAMLGAAILYSMHLPINQRVLLEVPSPTVTLYTLLAMSGVVVPAYFIFDHSLPTATAGWASSRTVATDRRGRVRRNSRDRMARRPIASSLLPVFPALTK